MDSPTLQQRRGEMPERGPSPSIVAAAGTGPSTSGPSRPSAYSPPAIPAAEMAGYAAAYKPTGKFTPEERRRISFETRVAFMGFMLHSMVQLMHMSCPWHERWQRIVSIPYTFTQVAFPLIVSGHTYLKYHDRFNSVFKVGFFMFPLLRRARGIQRVLDADPSPGLSGFILDLIKMMWGSRLFAVICSGVGTPLSSVGAQLAIQALSVVLVRGNGSLCTSNLLQHPLAVQRLRLFTSLSFNALMPAFGLGALVAGHECSFVFTLLHLLFGIVTPALPLILATSTFKSLDRRGRAGAVWLGLCAVWAAAAGITLWSDAM